MWELDSGMLAIPERA